MQRMSRSRKAIDRRRALYLMRRQIEERGHQIAYLRLARSLIGDRSNKCRWQALIVVGEFIKIAPDAVWNIARKYGVSKDEDMRNGVATVLLEHLLEYHFSEIFPKVKSLVLKDEHFADTFQRIWRFGQAKHARNSRRLDALEAQLIRREKLVDP